MPEDFRVRPAVDADVAGLGDDNQVVANPVAGVDSPVGHALEGAAGWLTRSKVVRLGFPKDAVEGEKPAVGAPPLAEPEPPHPDAGEDEVVGVDAVDAIHPAGRHSHGEAGSVGSVGGGGDAVAGRPWLHGLHRHGGAVGVHGDDGRRRRIRPDGHHEGGDGVARVVGKGGVERHAIDDAGGRAGGGRREDADAGRARGDALPGLRGLRVEVVAVDLVTVDAEVVPDARVVGGASGAGQACLGGEGDGEDGDGAGDAAVEDAFVGGDEELVLGAVLTVEGNQRVVAEECSRGRRLSWRRRRPRRRRRWWWW